LWAIDHGQQIKLCRVCTWSLPSNVY
jgi:hypothetical protein